MTRIVVLDDTLDVALVDRSVDNKTKIEIVGQMKAPHPFCSTGLFSDYPSFQSASNRFRHNPFAAPEKGSIF
jgi:hypothetical protein